MFFPLVFHNFIKYIYILLNMQTCAQVVVHSVDQPTSIYIKLYSFFAVWLRFDCLCNLIIWWVQIALQWWLSLRLLQCFVFLLTLVTALCLGNKLKNIMITFIDRSNEYYLTADKAHYWKPYRVQWLKCRRAIQALFLYFNFCV